jgi:hypothetical protein
MGEENVATIPPVFEQVTAAGLAIKALRPTLIDRVTDIEGAPSILEALSLTKKGDTVTGYLQVGDTVRRDIYAGKKDTTKLWGVLKIPCVLDVNGTKVPFDVSYGLLETFKSGDVLSFDAKVAAYKKDDKERLFLEIIKVTAS